MVGCPVDASFPKMAYGFRAEKDRPRHLRSRNLKGDLNRGNESFNKTNYGLLYLLKFRLSSQFSLWAEVETDMDDFTSFPWGRNLRWDKLLALVSMEVRAFLFQSSFPSSLVLYFTYSRNTDWIPSREELNGQTWFRALLVRPLYIPSSSFLTVFWTSIQRPSLPGSGGIFERLKNWTGRLVHTEPNNVFDFFSLGTYELAFLFVIDQPAEITVISKIQLMVYYQCCVLIGWATTRPCVIAY